MREEKRHETEEDWEKSVTACRARDAVIAEMVMQPNIKHYSLEFNLMSVSILALTCGRLQKKKRCSVTSWWTHLPWNKNWNSQLSLHQHLQDKIKSVFPQLHSHTQPAMSRSDKVSFVTMFLTHQKKKKMMQQYWSCDWRPAVGVSMDVSLKFCIVVFVLLLI